MSAVDCTGHGTAPCVSPREQDRAWCLMLRAADRDNPRLLHAWDLALSMHDGIDVRREIGERFALLTEYLMLRGGTDFVAACKRYVAGEQWAALTGAIYALENDLTRDGHLRWRSFPDGSERAEPTGKRGMRIPEWIAVVEPLFPVLA